MPHPLPTDLTNSSTGLFEGMAIWAYEVTNGIFWAAMLLGFCVVMWIATSRYSNDRAFGYAGIIALFGSTILATLTLMTWWLASIFILAGALGVAYMVVNK